MKGAMSAQKALQGPKTETREMLGGMEEKNISSTRGHISVTKMKQKIIELVARPDKSQADKEDDDEDSEEAASKAEPTPSVKEEPPSKSTPLVRPNVVPGDKVAAMEKEGHEVPNYKRIVMQHRELRSVH